MLFVAYASNGQHSLNYGMNSVVLEMCFGNCSTIEQNPNQLLYRYNDGGFDSDMSSPQFKLEEIEVEDMLDNVASNINYRISNLKGKHDQLKTSIDQNLPAANQEKEDLIQETVVLNEDLNNTINRPDVTLNLEEQARMKVYLKEIHALKNTSQQELNKAMNRRKLNEEAREDLQEQRSTLLDETTWHTSDGAMLIGILASNINATSNLIYDLLAINPAVSKNPVVAGIGVLKSTIEESLVKGEFDLEKIQKAFAQAYLTDGISAGNDLLQATNAFYELGKRISDMTDLQGDQTELKNEIQRQLDLIDGYLRDYEDKIEQTTTVIEMNRYIIRMIDDYLNINGISSEFDYIPLQTPPPNSCIIPEGAGFEFELFNIRDEVYDPSLSMLQRKCQFEGDKINSEYPGVLERFEYHTSRGEPDPVFASLQEYQSNERSARMCLQYSQQMQEDFDEIRENYPDVSIDLVHSWLTAAEETRYTALNYLPVSNATFQFTPVDMQELHTEITSAITDIQNNEPIPDYACNIYTATLVNQVYGKDIDNFKNGQGGWLNANQLAVKATLGDGFSYVGVANDQTAIDQATYFATIGKPVVAIYYNSNGGHGHINMLLPGLNTHWSEDWQRYVPLVTNYSLTQSGDCSNCFVEGRLSQTLGPDKAPHTIFYVVED